AVVEDHPGEAADAAEDECPQGAADDDEGPVFGLCAPADDIEHHDEDQGRRERLRDRIDEEQEGVGPVRLHLPAEADGDGEAPAQVGPAAGAGPGRIEPAPAGGAETVEGWRGGRRAVGGHCQRTESAPSRRARRSSTARHQRLRTRKTTTMPTRIAASIAGGGVPMGYAAPAKASWRIASSPTASGRMLIATEPRTPRRAMGKFSPETK